MARKKKETKTEQIEKDLKTFKKYLTDHYVKITKKSEDGKTLVQIEGYGKEIK